MSRFDRQLILARTGVKKMRFGKTLICRKKRIPFAFRNDQSETTDKNATHLILYNSNLSRSTSFENSLLDWKKTQYYLAAAPFFVELNCSSTEQRRGTRAGKLHAVEEYNFFIET